MSYGPARLKLMRRCLLSWMVSFALVACGDDAAHEREAEAGVGHDSGAAQASRPKRPDAGASADAGQPSKQRVDAGPAPSDAGSSERAEDAAEIEEAPEADAARDAASPDSDAGT
jgi:hypothetical protein